MARCIKENIKEYLRYDKETGKFFWIKPTYHKGKAGSEAGCTAHGKYKVIRFFGKLYYAHRLAWWFEYGEIPKIIDHINRDSSDNRIVNLRNTTQKVNTLNHDSINVWFRKDTKKWTGQVCKKSIGCYANKEEAIHVYLELLKKEQDNALLCLQLQS